MSTDVDTGLKRTITDEALADLRSRIGREFRTKEPPNMEEATKDGIRHWAHAIGDRDPKWTDEAYSAQTRFGGITAPPSMIYGFDMRAIGDRSGLPGVHSFFAGADHEWYLPINRNDRIDLKVVFTDLIEKPSKFAGRMFQQVSECTYTNQKGEVVAKSWPWGMRTERSATKSKGKYNDLTLATYTPSEIEAIAERYTHEDEHVRGANKRYWEDVAVGDTLGPIIRGPWSPTISICFLNAHGGLFMKAHAFWYEYLQRHPKAGIPNEMGIPEGPVRGHWDSGFANKIGVPAAYDFGPERISWLTTLGTYWCGDDGWLKRLKVQVKRFNLVGDLTTIEGRVTGKSEGEDGGGLVDFEMWARDQRGADSATATGQIVLPRRSQDGPNE